METLYTQFQALDLTSQGVVVGLAVTAILGLAKKLWPALDASSGLNKFCVAVVLAGAAGYANAGWPGVVLPVLVALGGYDVATNATKAIAQVRGEES